MGGAREERGSAALCTTQTVAVELQKVSVVSNHLKSVGRMVVVRSNDQSLVIRSTQIDDDLMETYVEHCRGAVAV